MFLQKLKSIYELKVCESYKVLIKYIEKVILHLCIITVKCSRALFIFFLFLYTRWKLLWTYLKRGWRVTLNWWTDIAGGILGLIEIILFNAFTEIILLKGIPLYCRPLILNLHRTLLIIRLCLFRREYFSNVCKKTQNENRIICVYNISEIEGLIYIFCAYFNYPPTFIIQEFKYNWYYYVTLAIKMLNKLLYTEYNATI